MPSLRYRSPRERAALKQLRFYRANIPRSGVNRNNYALAKLHGSGIFDVLKHGALGWLAGGPIGAALGATGILPMGGTVWTDPNKKTTPYPWSGGASWDRTPGIRGAEIDKMNGGGMKKRRGRPRKGKGLLDGLQNMAHDLTFGAVHRTY